MMLPLFEHVSLVATLLEALSLLALLSDVAASNLEVRGEVFQRAVPSYAFVMNCTIEASVRLASLQPSKLIYLEVIRAARYSRAAL